MLNEENNKRFFPNPSEESKIEFIINTSEFSNIIITKEAYYKVTRGKEGEGNPYIAGLINCITLTLSLAEKIDLIPEASKMRTEFDVDKYFYFIKSFHKNIFYHPAKMRRKTS